MAENSKEVDDKEDVQFKPWVRWLFVAIGFSGAFLIASGQGYAVAQEFREIIDSIFG